MEEPCKLKIVVMNLNEQQKLLRSGHLPVYKEENGEWKHLDGGVSYEECKWNGWGLELQWDYTFSASSRSVSFTWAFPYSYEEIQQKTCKALKLNGSEISISKTVLCESLQGRNVDLVRVTEGKERADEEGAFF